MADTSRDYDANSAGVDPAHRHILHRGQQARNRVNVAPGTGPVPPPRHQRTAAASSPAATGAAGGREQTQDASEFDEDEGSESGERLTGKQKRDGAIADRRAATKEELYHNGTHVLHELAEEEPGEDVLRRRAVLDNSARETGVIIQESDIHGRSHKNGANASPVLGVCLAYAWTFFVMAQMNYMKLAFKRLHGIHYEQKNGTGRDYNDIVEKRGEYIGHGASMNPGPFEKQRQQFVDVYNQFCPQFHAFVHQSGTAKYTPKTVPKAFFRSNTNFQVPDVYKQYRRLEEEDGVHTPAQMSEEHARKILANELIRSAGVIQVFIDNAIDSTTEPVSVPVSVWMKKIVNATKTLQRVFSSFEESQMTNNAAYDASATPEMRYDQRSQMLTATLKWYFSEIGFINPSTGLVDSMFQGYMLECTQAVVGDWQELATARLTNELAQKNRLYGGEGFKEYELRKPKMYFCTQLFFIYWTRQMRLRQETIAESGINPTNVEEVGPMMFYFMNFFESYSVSYNKPMKDAAQRLTRPDGSHDRSQRMRKEFFRYFFGAREYNEDTGILERTGLVVQRNRRNQAGLEEAVDVWLSYLDCTNESNVIWSQYVHKSEEVRQEIAGLHGEIKRMTEQVEHVELTEANGSGWKQNTGKQTRAAYTRNQNAKNKYPPYKNKEDEKFINMAKHNRRMAENKAATNPIPKNARTHVKMIAGDNTQTPDQKEINLKRNEAAAKRDEAAAKRAWQHDAEESVRAMGFKTEEQKRIQEERERREQQEIRDQEEAEDLRHQEEMSANTTEPAYDPLKERMARTKNDIQQERGERSEKQRILDLHDQQREQAEYIEEEEEADRQKASLMIDREKHLQHAKRIEEARIKNEEERERTRR